MPNFSLRILPQRLLVLPEPNLPNLPALQATLQLRQRPRHIGLNERLHRTQCLIQLAHPRSLPRSPDLLLRAQDRLRQIL